MSVTQNTAVSAYGVLMRNSAASEVEHAVEQLRHQGYAVIDGAYSAQEVAEIGVRFDRAHAKYVEQYGEQYLRAVDEYNGIRLPLALDRRFIDLVLNDRVRAVLDRMISGKYVLNQQNGVINPSRQPYNQAAWHRDFPYQHFVSSYPLGVNALYCVDAFSKENGATHVLPASHLREAFPSDQFVLANQIQVEAPAGSFILIDGMTFHKGGFNVSSQRRRAVSHFYTIPYIRQQIDIPAMLGSNKQLAPEAAEMLGYRYRMPASVDEFLRGRE